MKGLVATLIVKDEASVILRCLSSVLPFVDAFIVVDTGSSDNTWGVVEGFLQACGKPSLMFGRPWVDFSTNRNEALGYAKSLGDYALVIDADDVLVAEEGFRMPPLEVDAYFLEVNLGSLDYWRPHIFRLDSDYRYEGVLHEALVGYMPKVTTRLEGLKYICSQDGSRSKDPEKYLKDACVLRKALSAFPDNSRYAFYLAQALRDAGQHGAARAAYRRRSLMGGFEEEVFIAKLRMAELAVEMGYGREVVVDAFLEAYACRPSRAEPLCYLASYLRKQGELAMAYPFARAAAFIAYPKEDVLFVDRSVYVWKAQDEHAISAYYAGYFYESLIANEMLLSAKELPAEDRIRIVSNRDFCAARTKL